LSRPNERQKADRLGVKEKVVLKLIMKITHSAHMTRKTMVIRNAAGVMCMVRTTSRHVRWTQIEEVHTKCVWIEKERKSKMLAPPKKRKDKERKVSG
jgi:hypothetical protein